MPYDVAQDQAQVQGHPATQRATTSTSSRQRQAHIKGYAPHGVDLTRYTSNHVSKGSFLSTDLCASWFAHAAVHAHWQCAHAARIAYSACTFMRHVCTCDHACSRAAILAWRPTDARARACEENAIRQELGRTLIYLARTAGKVHTHTPRGSRL